MYLNYFSEHLMSITRSIPYSQFLRLKTIHCEPQYLLEAQIHMYLFFIQREYPHDVVLSAWMKTNRVIKEQLLTPVENNQEKDIPLMFITSYSRANPNFKEHFPKDWPYLGRSSATRELGKQDFMITYRKPPSLKDMFVRAKITQPRIISNKGCNRPNTCKYCKKNLNQGELKT